MNRLPLLFLLLLTLGVRAQDIGGVWKGSLSMPGGCFAENNIEIQIRLKGDHFTGDSYHYLNLDNYVKKYMEGSWDPATRTADIQEGLVTTFKIRPECKICIKHYVLTYHSEGDREYLTGSWTGHIYQSDLLCDRGNITLTRVKESYFKEIPEVVVDTGNLKLDFYDNNQVDGDSITVRVNGKEVLTHQRLTTKPATIVVRIDSTQTFQEVEMIAENEGSIPPNTALLIVTAGNQRYELHLSSTQTKSARVRFIYDAAGENRRKPLK